MGGNGWAIWDVRKDEWRLVYAEGKCTDGDTTVNVEEFKGLERALRYLEKLPPRACHVFGDSKLVVGAMQGKMRCRTTSMQQAYARIVSQVARLTATIHFWHILRDFNQVADKLANMTNG